MNQTCACSPLTDDVGAYYGQRLRLYGATPLGVDWSCVPTQEMRFVQLLKLRDPGLRDYSLNDVGCGYGALYSFLRRRNRSHQVDFMGTDLSAEQIAAATKRWRHRPFVNFRVARDAVRIADYSVASGTFNVRLSTSAEAWEILIHESLASMRQMSLKGFAVNFLSPPANPKLRIPELYYASPEQWAAHCEEHFKVTAEIVSGYGLKEYTLLMRCGT